MFPLILLLFQYVLGSQVWPAPAPGEIPLIWQEQGALRETEQGIEIQFSKRSYALDSRFKIEAVESEEFTHRLVFLPGQEMRVVVAELVADRVEAGRFISPALLELKVGSKKAILGLSYAGTTKAETSSPHLALSALFFGPKSNSSMDVKVAPLRVLQGSPIGIPSKFVAAVSGSGNNYFDLGLWAWDPQYGVLEWGLLNVSSKELGGELKVVPLNVNPLRHYLVPKPFFGLINEGKLTPYFLGGRDLILRDSTGQVVYATQSERKGRESSSKEKGEDAVVPAGSLAMPKWIDPRSSTIPTSIFGIEGIMADLSLTPSSPDLLPSALLSAHELAGSLSIPNFDRKRAVPILEVNVSRAVLNRYPALKGEIRRKVFELLRASTEQARLQASWGYYRAGRDGLSELVKGFQSGACGSLQVGVQGQPSAVGIAVIDFLESSDSIPRGAFDSSGCSYDNFLVAIRSDRARLWDQGLVIGVDGLLSNAVVLEVIQSALGSGVERAELVRLANTVEAMARDPKYEAVYPNLRNDLDQFVEGLKSAIKDSGGILNSNTYPRVLDAYARRHFPGYQIDLTSLTSRARQIQAEIENPGEVTGREPLVGLGNQPSAIRDLILAWVSGGNKSEPVLPVVLLGPNGTGKSQIGARIIDALNVSSESVNFSEWVTSDPEQIQSLKETVRGKIRSLGEASDPLKILLVDEVDLHPAIPFEMLTPILGNSGVRRRKENDYWPSLAGYLVILVLNVDRENSEYQQLLEGTGNRGALIEKLLTASFLRKGGEHIDKRVLEKLIARLGRNTFFIPPAQERWVPQKLRWTVGQFARANDLTLIMDGSFQKAWARKLEITELGNYRKLGDDVRSALSLALEEARSKSPGVRRFLLGLSPGDQLPLHFNEISSDEEGDLKVAELAYRRRVEDWIRALQEKIQQKEREKAPDLSDWLGFKRGFDAASSRPFVREPRHEQPQHEPIIRLASNLPETEGQEMGWNMPRPRPNRLKESGARIRDAISRSEQNGSDWVQSATAELKGILEELRFPDGSSGKLSAYSVARYVDLAGRAIPGPDGKYLFGSTYDVSSRVFTSADLQVVAGIIADELLRGYAAAEVTEAGVTRDRARLSRSSEASKERYVLPLEGARPSTCAGLFN